MQLIFIKLGQRNFHLGLLGNMKYSYGIMDLMPSPFWKAVWMEHIQWTIYTRYSIQQVFY